MIPQYQFIPPVSGHVIGLFIIGHLSFMGWASDNL